MFLIITVYWDQMLWFHNFHELQKQSQTLNPFQFYDNYVNTLSYFIHLKFTTDMFQISYSSILFSKVTNRTIVETGNSSLWNFWLQKSTSTVRKLGLVAFTIWCQIKGFGSISRNRTYDFLRLGWCCHIQSFPLLCPVQTSVAFSPDGIIQIII